MKAITCPRSCRGTGCEPLPLVLLLMQLTAISTHLTNIYWLDHICASCCCLVASVMSNSFRTHGLQSTRLLCPWDSPGKNNRVGCHFLLQGIFLIQGSNPHLMSPALAGRFFTISTTWEAVIKVYMHIYIYKHTHTFIYNWITFLYTWN